MASSYPGSLDSFTNPASTDAMDASAALYHDVQHANANDAIEAVQAELGTDPAGTQSTVKARLEYVERDAPPGGGVWQSTHYLTNSLTCGAATSTAQLVGGQVYYFPWWCPLSVTLDRIAVQVTTGSASANARIGLYSPASDGMPGARVLDAGEIDCSSTGVKELTVSQAITGGTRYWLAIASEDTNVVYKNINAASARPLGSRSSTSAPDVITCCYETLAYPGSMPSSAGTLTLATTTPLVFWLRRS